MTSRTALLIFASFLAASQLHASLQCPPREGEGTLVIEAVDWGEVAPGNGVIDDSELPVAAFKISGAAGKFHIRVGFSQWERGVESPDKYRDGFIGGCDAFEHVLLVWLSHDERRAQVTVRYSYLFPTSDTDSPQRVLEISRLVHPEFATLEEQVTLGIGEDVAVWAVSSGAVPSSQESITDVVRRAEVALVLHVKNSPY